MKRRRTIFLLLLSLAGVGVAALFLATAKDLTPVAGRFDEARMKGRDAKILDRNGIPLSASYGTGWNEGDAIALHAVPEFLKDAFIVAEDKRFYTHKGPDWLARASALAQNLKCLCADRGASTITEQTVRMIVPRPRTLWTRWLEGWDAWRLERHATKQDILEFYLNQVPYAANRRGVVQAARYYFNRDLSTLSRREMLALAVLVRSPARYRFRDRPLEVERAIARLRVRMGEKADIPASGRWEFSRPGLLVEAPHFVRFARKQTARGGNVRTTLDGRFQRTIQELLDRRLRSLAPDQVHNGAILVANHETGEILAWANAGTGDESVPGNAIDAVLAPRQPGSSLKPFIYALALEKGWTAATLIDDAPLSESVGAGMHAYRNYSRVFYGQVTLRQALANSLNIPAVKAVKFVGTAPYLDFLHRIGFEGLSQHPDFYGDGIALGNGEVTLYELVQAYAVLANGGTRRPFRIFLDPALSKPEQPRRILREDIASLIGNILSDSSARDLEFGEGSVLDLPVQTAVKTGTSTDFRDAWAVGFNHRYVVGVWMGNLDRTATSGVSGSRGPALLLRSVFAELNRKERTKPLFLSPALESATICVTAPRSTNACVERTELFLPGTVPGQRVERVAALTENAAFLRQPTEGLRLAIDPRVPMSSQAFVFRVEGLQDGQVEWILNGKTLTRNAKPEYIWPIARGTHKLEAVFYAPQGEVRGRNSAAFTVR